MDCQIGPTGVAWAALRFGQSHAEEYDVRRPLRCPRCHCRDCVPSLPSRSFDRLFLSLHRVPYECRVCGKRFRWFDRQHAAQIAAALETMAF
jgi:hypothetical protein